MSELSPNDLRSLAAQVNKKAAPSVVLLASEANGKCGMVCICSEEAISAGHQAGKYLSELAALLGGKGEENLISPLVPLQEKNLTSSCEHFFHFYRGVKLRILLPPTMSGCVQRNAIPKKSKLNKRTVPVCPQRKVTPQISQISKIPSEPLYLLYLNGGCSYILPAIRSETIG